MRRARARRAHAGVIAIALLLGAAMGSAPRNARATWDDSGGIVRGSAQVLDTGEIGVGVFAPLSYGLSDNLMIQTHPVLDLLRLLNLAARWRLVSRTRWMTALTVNYKEALLESEVSEGKRQVDIAGVFTWLPHERIALTASLGLSTNISGLTSVWDDVAGVTFVGTGHFILHERHLLMGTVRVLRDAVNQRWETPLATMAWISNHRFPIVGNVDLVLGLALGEFRIRDPIFATANIDAKGVGQSWWYPVVDLWWRM